MADNISVQLPSLEDFLKSGVHFGHRKSRWHPKMEQYIYAERNGVHIIDLVKTLEMSRTALKALQNAADNGSILLVGTKGQAASMLQKIAEDNGAFYVNTRWPGGLFTNYEMIHKSVSRLIQMEEHLAGGATDLVKKEQLLLERDVSRLNKLYEGLKFMDKLPSMVVVIDSKLEKIAIKEAGLAGIPIVAIVDTNCDPELVTYPVPANDDSIKSIALFLDLFGKAIKAGKQSERVINLRASHKAKLEQLKTEFEKNEDLRLQNEELERERMKKLRAGMAVGDGAPVVVEEKKATVRIVKKDSTKQVVRTEEKEVAESKKPVSLKELGLSTRIVTALTDASFTNVSHLKAMGKNELKGIKGIGDVAADEIVAAIKKVA